MALDLVLFGNMCSGKTSVAQILSTEHKGAVVAAKEVVQRNLARASDEVRGLRARGFLLPDALVIEWIFAALDATPATGGPVILDGFPRTEPQARALLDSGRRPRRVVFLDFDLAVLKRRFGGRLLCEDCTMPASRAFTDFDGRCGLCRGTRLQPRPTDRPDYFEVKTGQFSTVSIQVLPALRAAGVPFAAIRDHTSFADLRAEVLTLMKPNGN